MSSGDSLRFASKTIRSAPMGSDILNQSLLPLKLNPHKITKESYKNTVLTQRSSIVTRRSSLGKNTKDKAMCRITRRRAISDMESENLEKQVAAAEILRQIQDIKYGMEKGKENLYINNLALLPSNVKDINGQKRTILGTNDQLLETEACSGSELDTEYMSVKKFNRFSTFEKIPEQFEAEYQGSLIEELNTPNKLLMRQNSLENDFSDRETMEESVSGLSDNIGSQKRLSKANIRVENTFGGKSALWNSQENSCCTTLDCEEAMQSSGSALLNEKKEDSIPDDLLFEQDFGGLFSSANTTPKQKDNSMNTIAMLESKQEKERTIEEELADFKPEINPCAFDSDTINYLIAREADYAPEPHYFEKKQTQINWSMRAILLDWMMEVCMEFCLKRETYHYAVNYVDRYLSAIADVQKWELQLVGVTALYMAAKVEEIYPPRVHNFAKATDMAYTTEQIVAMELKMLKALKWLLTPPTMNTWANWYMNQWDLYIERSEYAQRHPLVQQCQDELVQFKQSNQKSYVRFREMMQLIDCTMLDIQTLQYKPRALIASVLYISLGKHFKQFTTQQIFEQFPHNSYYLLDQSNAFNDLFSHFLLYSFGFELTDLLPSIQYVSTYIKLIVSLELPKAVKMSKENVLEGHFEEFLAYQTHQPHNIQYIKRRPRNNF